MNENTQEVLDEFYKDLDAISSPSEKIIQMGCFVEIIHMSLNETITSYSNSKLKKEKKGKSFGEFWEDKFKEHASLAEIQPLLCDAVKDLSEVYWARNQCAHKNELTDQINKKHQIYKLKLEEGISNLLSGLKGWKLDNQHKTFEDALVQNAERRPHFILVDELFRVLNKCHVSFLSSNQYKCNKISDMLNSLSDELSLSVMTPMTNLVEAHYEFFGDFCRHSCHAPSDIFSRLREHMTTLLYQYRDEGLLDNIEYNQYINPFIERHLKKSEECVRSRVNLQVLYIKLDHDDLTSPGWPQRLNDVQLIPNIRRAEEVIDSIRDGGAELFHHSADLATFIKKRLVNPLRACKVDVSNLALVIELSGMEFGGWSLVHEAFHLSRHGERDMMEELFKSVLIRLTDDPEEALSLKESDVTSFIHLDDSSGLITSRVKGALSDEVNGSPEVVLLAEEAVVEEDRDFIYERVYKTNIPLIVMSLNPGSSASYLNGLIFENASRITLNQLFKKIKSLRTTRNINEREPIQLFIDDAELNPHLATPLSFS